MKYFFSVLVCSALITACLPQGDKPQIASTESAVTARASMSSHSPTSILTFTIVPSLKITSTPLAVFTEDENRSLYSDWEIGDASASDYREFWKGYEFAVRHNEVWIQDPLEVASHFINSTKSPGEPSCREEKAAYLPTNDMDKAIFIFIFGACPDDSLGKVKMRIELSRKDKIWKIEWLGGMKKCRRGSEEFQNNWHNKICS